MDAVEETDLLEPIGEHVDQAVNPSDLLSLPPAELDTSIFDASLLGLGDVEAAKFCVTLLITRSIDDFALARHIVRSGISRGQADADRAAGALGRSGKQEEDVDDTLREAADDTKNSGPTKGFTEILNRLKELEKRLDTFAAIVRSAKGSLPTTAQPSTDAPEGKTEMDIDDPWAENEDAPEIDDPWESGSAKSSSSKRSQAEAAQLNSEDEPPISLSELLSTSVPDATLAIASSAAIPALKIVYSRHEAELWPYREALLEAVPAWVSPADLKDIGLLPGIGDDGEELGARLASETEWEQEAAETSIPSTPRRSADQVRAWYISKIESLDALGLLDTQLAWVQQGASMGVSGLDELGEELSLMSRLVYDAHLSATQQVEWSLASWRRASPDAIIKGYLTNATSDNIVSDIRRLVLPYLYVLESKAERAGEAHTDLVENHLHDILLDLPLDLALPIFEASKATLGQSERIIKNDMTVARLALACLYGSNTRSQWSIMSSIFECLPVWDVSGGDVDSDKEATATTLDSIATFVRPTRAGAHPPTAKDLFLFFSPLPFASLSRALDILDVHLESGELLARWDTPVQLRFLLQSARDKSEQIELAEKMVRRQVGANLNEARWSALWQDMKRLSGGDDALLRGAFGVLTHEDMMRIYLAGVLASGKFDIARKMVAKLQTEKTISDAMLEGVVLQTSREFYENAESGNIHTGDMKLAYDCLGVAPTTESITREREFIEATSRIATYNLKSSSGRGSLSPLEIRHSKNRLDFVKQILETSDDAFRYPELVLTLVGKLGYHNDAAAQISTRALMTESAIRNGDFDVAYTHSQDMFSLVTKRKPGSSIIDIVWQALVHLGEQADFPEISKKSTVLGQALELCPPAEIPSIMSTWRTVEDGQIKLTEAAKRRRLAGIRQPNHHSAVASPTSPSRVTEERVLGSRTAARAARLAMGFAGDRLNFRGIASSPLLSSPTPSQDGFGQKVAQEDQPRRSGESDRPAFGAMFDGAGVKAGTAEAERVRQQARKALVRGVGWLLGADEREISEGHR